MKTNPADPAPSRTRRRLAGAAILLLAAVSAAILFARRTGSDAPSREALFAALEGPLTISVTESGSIQSRDKVVVRSAAEGRNTIISIVPEGRIVQAGDLLIELDASTFQERKIEQQIRAENTEAALAQSREKLEVVRNQAQADIEKAELDLKFARLNLEKYIEGEYPRELRQAEADIAIAGEELQRAEDKLAWSRTLAESGYITRSELQGDELALKRTALNLELAENKLDLLKKYNHVETSERRRSDVSQAEMALDRIRRRAASDIVQAEVDLRARDSEHERQKSQLEKTLRQIEACRITAPAGGMVVYATSVSARRWNQEPLGEGQQVIERQELIFLPADSAMMAEIRIHESSLPKLQLGLPARVTVDALPGRVFPGILQKIALLPDANRSWMNPDLKVYVCEVHFPETIEGLRPGMNCQAEVLIEQHEKAVYVPVQAVTRFQGRPAVYIPARGELVPRIVEVGLDNNRMIHIKAGLEAGESVVLAPPLPQEQAAAPAAEDTPPFQPPEGGRSGGGRERRSAP